jgi:glycosyltransferase involved in cell wall biosynthesis
MRRMRLVLDLRLGTVHRDDVADEDERRLRPQDLAARVRRPSGLLGELRGRPYEAVAIVCDDIPVNGVQAGAMLMVAFARAPRFEVIKPGRTERYGRLGFLIRALGRAFVTFPLELARTGAALARVARIASRDATLAPAPAELRSALYLYRPLSTMGSSTGGAAVHTAGVIEGLAQHGLGVDLLGPQMPAGVECCELTPVPVRRRYHLVQWLTASEYSHELVDAASKRDVSFAYERSVAGSYAGVAVAKTLGIPLVLEFNGSDVWIAEHWGGRRLACSKLAAALERRNLRSASLVVVLSEALKEDVIARGVSPERVLVNPVGVDVAQLAPLRAREPAAWRRELGLEEAPTVAFIGTFGPWHGVGMLADMIERTAAAHPDARWLLIGGGPLHSEVVREIERHGDDRRVTVTGVVPRDQAVRLLAAADVCVSPHIANPDGTRFFGSPTKLFEYMALGKAIVASDLEQIGDVIDHGRNGLLHPPEDAAAAAEAVSLLLADQPLRARLGETALEDAFDRFSWLAHVRRTLDALVRTRGTAG